MNQETIVLLEKELTISLAELRQYMTKDDAWVTWEFIESAGEYGCAFDLLKHIADEKDIVIPNLENAGRMMGLIK